MSTLFHNSTSDDHIKTNRSEDRIITIELIDDQAPSSSTGIVDKRLFKGGNRLHAQRDENFLWLLRYDQGSVPPALAGRWTHFPRLLDDITLYFKNRNLSVKRIED